MIRDSLRHFLGSARGFTPDTRRFLLGVLLMGVGFGASQVHLNLLLASLGHDEAFIGRVLAAWSVGIVAVSLPAASWVDRWPPGRIFTLNAAGYALCLLAMVAFPEPWLLVPLSAVTGALFAVHWVAEAPFFARTEGPEHRTELFGLAAALESLAVILAAWGAGQGAKALARATGSESEGLRWALGAAAVFSLLATVPFSRIRTPAPAAGGPGRVGLLRSPSLRLILKVTAPAFIIGFGAGLTIPFLNLYFRDRFGKGPASVGLYFSVAQVLTMAGFLAGPALARRFGAVRAVVATELLSVPFLLLLAATDRLWLAVGAFWIRGALMNMNQPVSMAFAMEIVPPADHAAANAVRTFLWNGSWMLATAAGGWIIRDHGYAPAMVATAGCYVLAAALFWAWFRERDRGTLPGVVPPARR